MSRSTWLWVRLILSVILIVLAWLRVSAAQDGLTLRWLQRGNLPLLYMVSESLTPRGALEGDDAAPAREVPAGEPGQVDQAPRAAVRVPGVVIAHGFAGSKQVMLGYAYTLAHAGYAVILPDLAGHGANLGVLDRDALPDDLDAAFVALTEQPEVDPSRVALIGHSMGATAVLAAAARDPLRYRATVAISEPGTVSSPVPANLMLQAGSWEPRTVDRAQALLQRAGGESDDFAGGRARRLVVVPRAEHVGILFRPASHHAALEWLSVALTVSRTASRVTGEPQLDAASTVPELPEGWGRTQYVDRRIAWYGASVLGWALLLSTMAPVARSPKRRGSIAVRRPLHALILVVAPLASSIALALAGPVVDLPRLLGLGVGAAFASWLLVAGGIWLLAGFYPGRPTLEDLGWGLLLFGVLWLAFAPFESQVLMHWGLVGPRLLLWPLVALACLPWFVAAEASQGDPRGRGRLAWWLGQSVAVTVGLTMLVVLVPGLGMLSVVILFLPLLFAFLSLSGRWVNRPWSYGIGCALFFVCRLVAMFPLTP